jgi:SNF2 family DNA or RNA helicase
MTSAIKDNQGRGKVGDFLKTCLKDGSRLSFVSAYFTIYAYEKLKDQLHKIDHLNFLFGEPRFVKSLDPDRTDKKAFKIEDEKLALSNRLKQKRLAKECSDWISDRVDIRSIKQANLLHGKMYHIDDDGRKKALVGSSNFTVSGLGYGANPNIELNLEVADDRDRDDLKQWFDEIWNNEELVEDVKQDVLTYLEQLYAENSPQFIYYKTLFHVFEKFLTDQRSGGLLDERTNFYDTKVWNALFDFQKDGVKGAINKVLTHNGCIIADSVGLGKTFEALAVIKYFELLNQNVLVLCPKKLRENWTIYQASNPTDLNLFREDRFFYTVLSHTDLSREGGKSGDIDLSSINWGNFGLVVIDESHNFRNNTKGKKDEDGNLIRISRYDRLMQDIIKSGMKTKVLMLTATPVNNNLKDIRNQIYFITEGHDTAFQDTLHIRSIGDTLKNAQTVFTHWSKLQNRDVRHLLEKLDSSFFKLLDELTIARSRRHIQRFYKESIHKVGDFPVRENPISIYPMIDLENRFISYNQLNREIHNYKLSLFNPSEYVLPEFMGAYEDKAVRNFSQKGREHFLIGMMKVNFLKRLESSVSSFASSMQRTVQKIQDLEKKISDFQDNQGKVRSLDFDDLHFQDNDDVELEDAWEVGGKIKFEMQHLDLERWLEDLANDREQLKALYEEASKVTVPRDAKLADLKELIKAKISNPTVNKDGKPNKKVLIFTAFADTALYLYEAIKEWARKEHKVHISMVSGGAVPNRTTFGTNEYNNILINFSPLSKSRAKMESMPQDEEIDILIATDCISEGQNLQDCDTLINYDIHWNPVRIIQRFGRIDRIGSRNKTVRLVNFWPTKDLDNYIALKDRVEARMALVDIAATSDDNLLQEEIKDLIEGDIKYRDKQLKRLKDEVLDLEDVNDGVSLSEFTLDDFRIELANYIEANRKALEDAPLGLYAVVPPPTEGNAAQIGRPGVIFCLKQIGDTSGNEQVNPLQPYYLVYVRDDGEVRFNFTHAKHVLELFRAAASGHATAFESLCDLFNGETFNGGDMSAYDGRLEKAVQAIKHTFKKRNIGGLLSGRDGKLVGKAKQVVDVEDFELVTWLVIKGKKGQ